MLQLYTLSLRMFNRQDAIIVFLYNIVYRSFICIFLLILVYVFLLYILRPKRYCQNLIYLHLISIEWFFWHYLAYIF